MNDSSGAPILDPLTLAVAQQLAQAHHPDLRVARAELDVARADSLFAGKPTFNPELELQASRGGQSLGSGTDGSLELGVRQELELWGKRGARQAAAAARSRTREAEWLARSQEIEAAVRAHFGRALFLQDRRKTLDDLVELDRRIVRSTDARVRDGSITPLTGRMTGLELLRIETLGRQARSEHRQALVGLALAMGMELPDSTRLIGPIEPDSLRATEESIVVLALRNRRESDVLLRQLEEHRADSTLAEREARPNVTVGAGLAIDRQAFAGDDFQGDPAIVGGITGVEDKSYVWKIGVSLPLPLWQRNQADRSRATAGIARARAEHDRFVSRTRLEVLGAIRRFEEAESLYRLYLDRSEQVREDLALVGEAYTDGRIPLDSYLTQKGRLVDTLIAELDAADGYWEARGQLESVVGTDVSRMSEGGAR